MVVATATAWTFADTNQLLGAVGGTMAIILGGFRIRREYLRRNAGFSRDKHGRMKTDFKKEVDEDSML